MNFLITFLFLLASTLGISESCKSFLLSGDEFVEVNSKTNLNFGYSKESKQIKIDCVNLSTKAFQKYLRFSYPLIDSIRVSKIGENGLEFLADIGDTGPNRSSIKAAFPLSIKANDSTSFLIDIQTNGSYQLDFELFDAEAYSSLLERISIFLGLYYGIIFSIFLYNLFLFAQTLEKSFILYSCYIFFYALFMLNVDGISSHYLWPSLVWWGNYSTNIFIPVFLYFMVQFTLKFLSVQKISLLLSKILNRYSVCLLFYAIFVPILPYRFSSLGGAFLGFATVLVLYGVGFYSLFRKSQYAKYYLSAWSFLIFGIVFVILRNTGVVASNFFTSHSMHIGSAAEALLLSLGLGSRLKEADKATRESEKLLREMAAITRTTQILAHDVRKPFTLISAVVDMVTKSKSRTEAVKILTESLPDISSSLTSVNGMINDVMEVGRVDSKLLTQPESIKEVLNEALANIFRFLPNSKITIDFVAQHQHKIEINRLKVARVFSNILSNAVEHMKNSGKIWIRTIEQSSRIEICLGNSNSYIPDEDRKQLFEAFFTKGKQGGTGLGLSIAKKVVEAHGGKIWCNSSQEWGTEFFFTLPLSKELDESNVQILKSSTEYYKAGALKVNLEVRATNKHVHSGAEEAVIEYNLNKAIKNEPKLAIIDDEAIYRWHLRSHIEKSKDLSNKCIIVEYGTGEDALAAINKGQAFDVVILDVDLGKGQANGFYILQAIRKALPKAKISIHSNRGVLEYQSEALKSGADLFLPKPMPRLHLLKILASAVGLSDDDMRLDSTNTENTSVD